MTKVFTDLQEWQTYRAALSSKAIGFVPTMGGLHDGHRSLMQVSLARNELTVVSLFLNPTQFENAKDLQTYPASFEKDLACLEDLKVDAVLAPPAADMYPDGYLYRVTEEQFSKQLCGKHRTGHFDGVLTVVLKLLNLVRPTRAYFGEKDYQQLRLIEGMAKAFFLPTEIVACPTIRAPSGLALSSRNMRLDPAASALAPEFFKALQDSVSSEEAAAVLQTLGFEVDYVEDHQNRRFGAVRLGDVRLIDNVAL